MLRFLLVLIVQAASATLPALADAGEPPAPVSRFWSLDAAIPPPFRDALRDYAEGRFFDVLADLEATVGAKPLERAREDATILRALTLCALGWDDLAAPLLTSVLESREVSTYYPLALLELIEIHYRADRWSAAAKASSRYFEEPLRGSNARAQRTVDLLFEFGALRSGSAKLSPKEKRLLSRPEELKVRLDRRREQVSDRVLYLSGVAALRSERYPQSLRTLLRIGLLSPYYPYALYTIAQDQFVLKSEKEAFRALDRLVRYPETRPYERALESRARLLKARILFESGALEQGARITSLMSDEDPYTAEAQLLTAEALVGAGQPALALAYAGGTGERLGSFELDGRRGLIFGSAYADLGDRESGARVLKTAAQSLSEGRLDDEAFAAALERLRDLAAADASESLEKESEQRRHLSEGVRKILAYRGWGRWWNLGRIGRAVGVVLGDRPHSILARGMKAAAPKVAADDVLWLRFLQSPERATVALGLRRLTELEKPSVEPTTDAALQVVNAYLSWLDRGAESGAPDAKDVADHAERLVSLLRKQHGISLPGLDLDPRAPLGPQIAAYRGRLATSAKSASPKEPAALEESLSGARDELVALFRASIDGELRRFLRDRENARERLEFEVELALAQTMAREGGAAK